MRAFINHRRLAAVPAAPWIGDATYVIQIAMTALAFGLAWVFSTSECTTCLPSYRGFLFYGGDAAWMQNCLVVGAAGVPALVYPVEWLRTLTLLVHSICAGFVVHLLFFAPAPVIGIASFTIFTALSWWAIWRLGARA